DAVLAALVEGLDDNLMSRAPGINAPLDRHTVPLPRTARALVAYLQSQNCGVRYLAARALSRLPASAAISAPALEAALEDEDELVRLAVAASLVAIGRMEKGLPALRATRRRLPVRFAWAYPPAAAEADVRSLLRLVRDKGISGDQRARIAVD